MFKYTNILTGNKIVTNQEIKGKNWVLTDEIENFREQARVEKAKTQTKEKKVKEEAEKPVVSKIEIPNDLESLTKSDLSELLFSMDVEHNTKMTKDELIALIEENR